MHYQISKVELKQQAARPDTWTDAYSLYLKKSVGILTGWGTQHIHTTVLGKKTNEVRLSFNIDGDLEVWTCTCDESDPDEGLCEHTIATFLKMYDRQLKELQSSQESELGWPFNDPTVYSGKKPTRVDVNHSGTREDDSQLNRLLHQFEKALDVHEKEPLRVEFQLEFHDQVYLYGYAAALSLRIGTSRLYIVKDIKNFLRCIIEEDKEHYTKNFEFDGKRHTFDPQSMDIINMLINIYEDEIIRENSRYISEKTSHLFDRKYVLLSSHNFEKLIRNVNIDQLYVTDGSELFGAKIAEKSPEFDFYIEDFEEQLCIRMNEDYRFQVIDKDCKIIFDGQDTFYLTEKRDRGALVKIDELFQVSSEVLMPMSRIEDIANSIFPVLKKVGTLHISKDLSERMIERHLEKRLYMDYSSEGISIRINFVYGDMVFDPSKEKTGRVSKSENQDIILRDIGAERQFLSEFDNKIYKETETGYMVSGEHFEYLFLSDHAPKLMADCVIYATEAYRNKRVISEAKIHQSVRLSGGEDYLEYNFSIDGLSDAELKSVLKAYRQKKSYYKLKQGGFLELKNDSFEMLSQLANTFDIKSKNLGSTMKLPSSAAFYVDYHLEKAGEAHVSRNETFKALIGKLKSPDNLDIEVPSSLENVLREYQVIGYQWLQTLATCKMGGILADDMGLGKTLQLLTFLLSQKQAGEKHPSLIIAPTSLVYNWAAEIEKFTPELKYKIVHGTKKEREDNLKDHEVGDVYITSYATLRRDIDLYEEMNFSTVILDEAQHIKNESSKAAQSVKQLMAKHRFALTGTPMENHLGEFWSIFDFVLPGHLGSKYSFTNTFEKPIVKEGNEGKSEALRAMIKPFLLRRLKVDVLPELPDKLESQISIEMTEEQKKVYAATVSRIRSEINTQIKDKGFAKSQLQILAALTRLRQICSHPSVFIENYEGSSGKFEALRELLEELKDSGHRPLIFSQFTSVLTLIRDMVEDMGLEYHYLDGGTKAKDRGKMVDDFNAGQGDLFLISLKAGGSGLNLTGADTVIHFDPWWNPAVEDQASDRAYRIGQTKNVHVMKLVTRGSIEEKIIKLQDKKRELIDKIIKPGETLITALSEDEIKGLFDIV